MSLDQVLGSGMPSTGVLVLAGVLLVLGALVGEVVRRRLQARGYRYPDERDYPQPRQWWLAPVGALLWAGLGLSLAGRWVELAFYLGLSVPLLVLAGIDHDVHRLPDRIQKPLMLLTPVFLLGPALATGDWWSFGRALIGALLGYALYFVLAWFGQGGLGWGDVKLALILGAACGWLSWTALWVGLVAGFFIAALWGMFLILTRRATRKDYIPLGPFLIVGALGTIAALA